MHYRIGTRGSKLALVQSEYVKRRMEEAYPEDTFELVIIKTTGDKVTDKPLAAIGTKGLFVKEIEEELLSGSIDMAVHSMKDMPAECETGLTFAKAWKREDCRDVLILKTAGSFSELPSGAVIGTGSLGVHASLQCCVLISSLLLSGEMLIQELTNLWTIHTDLMELCLRQQDLTDLADHLR